ncbi:MAG: PD-(D/E)XK nuclease family protein [Thermodesulfobacteriota bacterium]
MSASLDKLKKDILEQMPILIEQDPSFRIALARMLRGEFMPREESESRFDRILDELRQDREEQNRKWEEQNRKWEEQNKKFEKVHAEIMANETKLDRSIGALGARWGTKSEESFRNALAGILEQSFGVQVFHVTEYDDQGEVFGRPDQIELDVIITNGLLILCELKSSVDKAAMYAFERKVRFYEKRHERRADRMIIVSPMVDAKAMRVAQKLGIEVYSDSTYVPLQKP